MSGEESSSDCAQLLEVAYRQTLARFHDQVSKGERDPLVELPTYRKQRRNYATLLRLGTIPDEARELAEQLLNTHQLSLDSEARDAFERDTTSLLIRLYDAFIESANEYGSRNVGGNTPNDQGNK